MSPVCFLAGVLCALALTLPLLAIRRGHQRGRRYDDTDVDGPPLP